MGPLAEIATETPDSAEKATCPDAAPELPSPGPGAASSLCRGRRPGAHLPAGSGPEPLPIHHCPARRPAWLLLLPPLTEEQRGSGGWRWQGPGQTEVPCQTRTGLSLGVTRPSPASSPQLQLDRSPIRARREPGRPLHRAGSLSLEHPLRARTSGGHGVGQESLCDPALPCPGAGGHCLGESQG